MQTDLQTAERYLAALAMGRRDLCPPNCLAAYDDTHGEVAARKAIGIDAVSLRRAAKVMLDLGTDALVKR